MTVLEPMYDGRESVLNSVPEVGEVDPEEVQQAEAFHEKMKATRLRRLAEFEMHLRPGQRIKRVFRSDPSRDEVAADSHSIRSAKDSVLMDDHVASTSLAP